MAVTHVMTSCNVPPQKARTAFSWFTPSALSLSMAGPKSSRHDRVSTGRAQFFSFSAPACFLSRQLWNHFISFYSALLRQTDRFPNTPPSCPPACAIIEKSPMLGRSTFLLAGELPHFTLSNCVCYHAESIKVAILLRPHQCVDFIS
jgi:hypothetical protein